MLCSEILLPPHAPPSFADRQTLWNEVEKAERGKKAQLAYSLDSALQTEFSMQENIDRARQFLLEQFVSRGMVVDFSVHAPAFADRQTLWNEVEKAERGKKAQLAYSFDIALQNEFSMQENIDLARQFLLEQFVSRGMVVDFSVHAPDKELAYSFDIALQNEFSMQENIDLARQFLLEQFVSRGMVVDFSVHAPDKEDSGIANPHFHVMCPIRPLLPDGKWGNKQRREYLVDENGERIRDEAGNYVFNAVPTTDWGKPETLEHWREQWATMCNARFSEKGLECRIDHRSYERQGVEQLPTVHEGPAIRQMEARGIRTDKGEFNRWVKATNALIGKLKKKIAALLDWLKEAHEELTKPQAPNLAQLLSEYYTNRSTGAWSRKAKIMRVRRSARWKPEASVPIKANLTAGSRRPMR